MDTLLRNDDMVRKGVFTIRVVDDLCSLLSKCQKHHLISNAGVMKYLVLKNLVGIDIHGAFSMLLYLI